MFEVTNDRHKYLPLLLLGDEQEELVLAYLNQGRLYAIETDGNPLAVALIIDHPQGVELKNMAVSEHAQGRGIGTALLADIFPRYTGQAMFVGTGEVPKTLCFYEKSGFAICGRVKNFFLDHYDHVIIEDGIQLVDMIYLKKEC